MKILLICGHGAGDPGACGCGCKEATLVREYAPLLKEALSDYAEVTIFDTSKNMYSYLKSGNTFNFQNYNYVLELHFNAAVNDINGNGVTTGTEILVHPSERGIDVENAILNNICSLGFKNRGVKVRNNLLNMNICRGRQGVSYALLETCFIDDADDVKLFKAKKNEVVSAIARGIISGFGLGTLPTTSDDKKEGEKMIYNYIDDNMPGFAKPTIEKLYNKGLLQGDSNGLGLTYDMLRILVILDRTGVFDKE